MAEAAKKYCFVHASIFHCDDTDPAKIVTFAKPHHNLIREVAKFQMAKLGTLPPDLLKLRRGEPTDVGFLS